MTNIERATREGTREYADRMVRRGIHADHYRNNDRLTFTSIGIGTYLGGCDDRTDRMMEAAIVQALESGCNVVDTAINYRCQRSERIIGKAIREVIQKQSVRREEIVVSTKGGFLPFDKRQPANPESYLRETFIRSGILKDSDIVSGCHAMTPAYIQNQLDRSLENLGFSFIDIYYLHNPETQLGDVTRKEFLDRIRNVFLTLEDNVSKGKIGIYGTATWNGYRVSPSERDHLSLNDLFKAAQDVGGPNHHFRVVQLPYNLAMPEALTEPTQIVDEETVCLLEAADRLGVYVMASASLYQGKLVRRLPPILRETHQNLETDAQRALQFVRSTPKMGTALVGMKRSSHVTENLGVAAIPPVPVDLFFKLFSAES